MFPDLDKVEIGVLAVLLILVELLQKCFHWKIPAAFTYFSTRMLLASATALLFTIFLGPLFIRKLYEWKMGQPIRTGEECPLLAELHSKKRDTPTMGGALILFSMAVSLLLWMDLTNPFTLLLLAASLVLGTLGAIDDYLKLRYKNSRGIKARYKMLVQFGFAFLVAFYLLGSTGEGPHLIRPPTAKERVSEGKMVSLSTQEYMALLYVPFVKKPVAILEGGLRTISFLLILLVIAGTSNAVNLTDGLDGLAAGCLVMVALVLALFAFLSNHIDLARYLNILYIEGSGEIAVYMMALAGACLGFLWYNGHPAQVFMGDTGSLALGGIIGLSAVLLRREFILALAGGVFVVEALSVIMQVLSYRYRNKKRIFLCTPLHHHFEYKGWPETKVVVRFWIISLFLAVLAVASLKFQ